VNFAASCDLAAGFPGIGSPSHPVLDLTSLDLTTGTAGGTPMVSVTETDFTTTTDPMQFLSSAPEPATLSVLGAALLMMLGIVGTRRVEAIGRHAVLAFS